MADVSMDKLSIEIESSVKDSSSSITKLIGLLTDLKNGIDSVVDSSSRFSEFKKNFETGNTFKGISKEINNAKKSINGISSTKIKAPKVETSSLQNQLSDLNIDLNTSKLLSSTRTINSEVSKYKTLTGDIVTINTKFGDSFSDIANRLQPMEMSLNQTINASKGLTNTNSLLSNSFSLVKGKTDGVASGFDKVKVSIKEVNNETNQLSNNTSKLQTLQSQLSALNINLDNAKVIKQFRDVNTEIIKYKTLTGDIVTVNTKFGDSFNSITSRLENLKVSESQTINASKGLTSSNSLLSSSFTLVKSGTNGVATAMDKVKVSVENTNKKIQDGTSLWDAFTKGISGSIVKMEIVLGTIKRVTSLLAGFVNKSSEYTESLNLFTVTMGDYAEEGLEWVEKFSNALYLDPANVMQYMGTFNSLTKGLGVANDKAYLMSQNLTQLTYDLASFRNIKPEEAYLKLKSAISGEIEPLRNVGVALSQNTLQELANSLGIEKRVASMSEAEKAQLRYIQIMKSSTEWQTDMGRTLITPANAIRILREQFNLLGRAIGNVLIPAIMLILPYMVALTQILTQLAQKVANFVSSILGIKIDINYDETTKGLGDIGGGIEDIGDEAGKATKKLNTMLAPFDELNVVQNKVDKASSGIGDTGLGGDLGVDLPVYDALANLTNKFSENVENAKEKIKDLLPIVEAVGVAFLSWKISSSIIDFLKYWGLVKEDTFKKAVGLGLIISSLYFDWKAIGKLYDPNSTDDEFGKALLEQFGSTVGVAGGTYMLTKSVKLTLLVTAAKLLIDDYVGLQKLIELDPTWEEIASWFSTIPITSDIGNLIGDTVFNIQVGLDWLNDKAVDIATTIGNFIGDTAFNITLGLDWLDDKALEIATTVGNFIGDTAFNMTLGLDWLDDKTIEVKDFITNLPDIVSEKWEELKTKVSEKIDEMKEKAEKKWEEIKTIIGNKIEEAKGKVSKKIEQIKTFFRELPGNIASGISSIPNKVSTIFTNAKKEITTIFGNIKTWFVNNFINPIATSFSNLQTSITDIFKGLGNGIIGIFNNVIRALNNLFKGLNKISITVPGWVNALLGKGNKESKWGFNIKMIKEIEGFEDGGYPSKADFFYMNENGIPEMLGKIGNQTAVANNDQITTALENAVVRAFSRVNNGNNNPVQVVVQLGNETLYSGMGKRIDSENDRYGTNYVNV